MYFLQHGEEQPATQPKRPRPAAELEVRPGYSIEDQLAVVVASLLDDQKSDALDVMKGIFGNVINEMRLRENETEVRRNAYDTEEIERQSISTRSFNTSLTKT